MPPTRLKCPRLSVTKESGDLNSGTRCASYRLSDLRGYHTTSLDSTFPLSEFKDDAEFGPAYNKGINPHALSGGGSVSYFIVWEPKQARIMSCKLMGSTGLGRIAPVAVISGS